MYNSNPRIAFLVFFPRCFLLPLPYRRMFLTF
jgi:hypothetical protein